MATRRWCKRGQAEGLERGRRGRRRFGRCLFKGIRKKIEQQPMDEAIASTDTSQEDASGRIFEKEHRPQRKDVGAPEPEAEGIVLYHSLQSQKQSDDQSKPHPN